ncbi:hypothetical protein BJX66DRAFT_341602 [Aspergillus keveii]|uniref:Uncharacterized protein n=1 Tax=Aspergillus keveii TaxID=714993 RepID=A0ABR4FUR8_9EURO
MTFDPSLEHLRRRIPTEQRLVHSGGNFLEIRQHQGIDTIQVIHQTVREFILRPDGCVATSAWRMVDEATHKNITIASIRYLLVLIREGPLDYPSNWASTQFEQYVRHLNGMPFAAYIVPNLDHHLNYCFAHPEIVTLCSTFIGRLLKSPSYHLLHHWVRQRPQYDVEIEYRLKPVFEPFRDMALIFAARQGHLTPTEVAMSAGANPNCGFHLDAKDK